MGAWCVLRIAYITVMIQKFHDIRVVFIYPKILKLTYDNTRTRTNQIIGGVENVNRKSPLELFEELYEFQNNQPMSEVQRAFARELIEGIQEGSL